MTDWTLGLFRGGRLLPALFALTAAAALAQPKDDTVVYPRSTAAAAAPAARPETARSSTWLLLGAAGVAGAGWWFWRQRQVGANGSARADRKLAIAESRPLGNRQYLVVADYDGRKFLLGVCPGHIEMLAPLDGSGPTAPKP